MCSVWHSFTCTIRYCDYNSQSLELVVAPTVRALSGTARLDDGLAIFSTFSTS